ncbi:hypothetical protein PN462_05760 [Spirulina sp. CS-785/01]|uniref:hypothetical protein n=1 Tax=Spirulina sp. CS-785/01 TaxID=3021716 RepID=UPI00232CEA48|nr:hypothetical protein [Spirulina sp. CS-785/01]MDB9312602.1 hypothetical protein [Spirulina sp. CS-785/01]
MKKIAVAGTGLVFPLLLGYSTPVIAETQKPVSERQMIAQAVSQSQIETFAEIWFIVRNINLLALELTSRVLRSEGIPRERAVAIVEGFSNLDDLEPPLTDQEEQTFERVAPLIRGVSQFRQLAVRDEIQKAGLTVEEYEEIRQQIGESEALQQQFQEVLQRLVQEQ